MKNTLNDLNNHLFAEIERLGDEDLTGEGLEIELKRAKGIADIATRIIDNGSLMLSAMKFKDDRLDADSAMPALLGGGK